MSASVGHAVSLSLGRRIMCDLIHAGRRTPTAVIERHMNVAELRQARAGLEPRPSWCSIFTKAYAQVVGARPELRRALLTFPWQRTHECRETSVDIVAQVRLGEEDVVVGVPVTRPECRPLLELDRRLAWGMAKPIERLRPFRRARLLARLPRVIRHAAWWSMLNLSGRKRQRYFATFSVSSMANWGVDSLRPLTPLTSLLHYGVIGEDGNVTVRLTYDQRVLNSEIPALALHEMESNLQTTILAELRALSATPLAA